MSDVWYTTRDEKDFIDGLGHWAGRCRERGAGNPTPEYRLAALKGYRAAIQHRKYWGAIEVLTVERHLELAIARAETAA